MAKPGKHLIVPCAVCGEEYRQTRSDQLYCSSGCASRAWRFKHPRMVNCYYCKRSFDASVVKRRKYCSQKCASESERERKKGKTVLGKGWSKGKHFVSRKICTVCRREFYAPPSQEKRGGGKFCSVGCYSAARSQDPNSFPQTSGRRGRGGKREDLGGLFVRSSWEANYARYLNWLVELGEIESWEYEPETFEFEGIKRGTRFYTPDFKIHNKNGTVEWHEVKGYMDAKSRTKLKRMAKYYPDIKIVLVDKEVYYAIASKVKGIIPGWESRR